jgi:hypothetical protein
MKDVLFAIVTTACVAAPLAAQGQKFNPTTVSVARSTIRRVQLEENTI